MDVARLIRRAPHAARSRLAPVLPYTTSTILGVPTRVRYGTVDLAPDRDDGWTYHLIHESKVFFDIGCNVGFFSLVAAIDDPSRNIVSVDANGAALAIAAENLISNGFAMQLRFVLAFVSATDEGEVEFFSVGHGQAGSRYAGHAQTAAARHESFMIENRSIDAIVDRLGMVPDFVKVDVEGAEADALEGASALAARGLTRFLVEMHSPPEIPMQRNGELVLAWAARHGLDAWYLSEHRRVEDVAPFAHRGRCHLLLLPSGQPYPSGLDKIPERSPVPSTRP